MISSGMRNTANSYEVIATLGPATRTDSLRRRLLEAGATAFRLNTSHLDFDTLMSELERLQGFRNAARNEPCIVLDLQGSKWRLGKPVARELHRDERVRFIYGELPDTPDALPVPHRDFFLAAAECSGEVRVNDARVQLEIVSNAETEVTAVVRVGGVISPRKGVTVPGSKVRTDEPGEKDSRIIEATRGMTGISYAFSYLRDSIEMHAFRRQVGDANRLIAKIERATALEDVENIAAAADELWLCRGDLGAELGLSTMARAVHAFTAAIPRYSRPCILAGQVLEHMTGALHPTRSEICHTYDALHAGYAGFVLSDETAIGEYPEESCRICSIHKRVVNNDDNYYQ